MVATDGTGTAAAPLVAAVSTDVARQPILSNDVLAPVAVLLLLAAIVLPAVLATRLQRPRGEQ
ncbi:MAG: hypothetical protein JO222_03105 [Frankiales bacterium]|nr:hypothetical protein [Frankiales bacterium]